MKSSTRINAFMQLDKVDVAILRMLQEDCRLSFRDIAKKTGVSVPTVSARTERLERIGVVRGYHADMDVDKLGEETLLVIVKCGPQATEGVAQALAAMRQVRKLFVLRGARVFVEAVMGDTRSIDTFLDDVSRIQGVMEYDHHISTRRAKDEPSAVVEDSLLAVLDCFECHKQIEGEPIRRNIDGREHYFCCRSCEKLYVEKYKRIKAAV